MKRLVFLLSVFIFLLLPTANFNNAFAQTCGVVAQGSCTGDVLVRCADECLALGYYTDPDVAIYDCVDEGNTCLCTTLQPSCDGFLPDDISTCHRVSLNPECHSSSGVYLSDLPPYISCGGAIEGCCETGEDCPSIGEPIPGVCNPSTGAGSNQCILGYCCLHGLECCGDGLDNQRCDPNTIPEEEYFPWCWLNEDTNIPYCTCTIAAYGLEVVPGPEVFCVANDPENRTSDPASGNIATAIGCIPVGSPQVFIGFLLRWGVGIAGGIAFILVIYSGFLVITSGGNPQKLQAGKELLTAAITGLVLLIFGAFILEFIGVDILNIPGFGQ